MEGQPPGLVDVEFLNVFPGRCQIVKKHVAPDGDEFFPTGCAVLQQQIFPAPPTGRPADTSFRR
jgi:hypothetical protein